jgi:putative tricarboxylic transport membrane protein
MFVGNFMLLILNLPMVSLWIRLLMLPNQILYPGVLTFCCIGVYSIQNSPLDVLLAAGFGLAGFILRKLECQAAPLVLGFVLEPVFEENVRLALLISRGTR